MLLKISSRVIPATLPGCKTPAYAFHTIGGANGPLDCSLYFPSTNPMFAFSLPYSFLSFLFLPFFSFLTFDTLHLLFVLIFLLTFLCSPVLGLILVRVTLGNPWALRCPTGELRPRILLYILVTSVRHINKFLLFLRKPSSDPVTAM